MIMSLGPCQGILIVNFACVAYAINSPNNWGDFSAETPSIWWQCAARYRFILELGSCLLKDAMPTHLVIRGVYIGKKLWRAKLPGVKKRVCADIIVGQELLFERFGKLIEGSASVREFSVWIRSANVKSWEEAPFRNWNFARAQWNWEPSNVQL
jgi:hypothetical protein